jgi:hypothetical protein
VTLELLYGDHEGGQRMITRVGLSPRVISEHLASISRRPDPR